MPHSLTFQSTLRVRGATRAPIRPRSPTSDFNPRSPCGERLLPRLCCGNGGGISIHAPRAGSDVIQNDDMIDLPIFQSTLPVRGATVIAGLLNTGLLLFQSTLPVRGATAPAVSVLCRRTIFQSTLPVRGATSHGV